MREDEFTELAAAYQAELRAHCYRILGSVHDAEDALQEALVRAWKGIDRFEGRASVRTWLYSIATNTALDIARHRSRREFAVDMGAPAETGAELDPALTELPWLEPYPDQWLTPGGQPTPEARYEQRESIELAFVAAVQHLPPLQRAVLLLREVAGFSAAEIAGQLGTSAASVTSALQRARVTMAARAPASSQQSALRTLGDARTRELVRQYADAMENGDIADPGRHAHRRRDLVDAADPDLVPRPRAGPGLPGQVPAHRSLAAPADPGQRPAGGGGLRVRRGRRPVHPGLDRRAHALARTAARSPP